MTQKNKFLLIATLAISSSIFFAPVVAKNSELPININSVEASYDPKTETGIYKKDVIVTQGTLEIKADIATFYMKNSELDYLEAHGKPIKIKYLPDNKKDWVYAEGLILRYYPNRDLLVLEENAEITQVDDVIVADRVEYNTVSEKIDALSKENKRIQMTVQPKK